MFIAASFVLIGIPVLCIHHLGKEKPQMKDVQNCVIPQWASHWREMGTQLNIDQHMMSIIERDHPNDCTKCCFEMFLKWLCNNPDACWEDITTAVDRLLAAGM